MFKQILVPVDGSVTSAIGLYTAIELAVDQIATLHILHVVDETVLTQSVVAGGYLSEDVLKAFVDGGQKVLDAAIDRAKARGVTAHGILVEDITETVADVIVTEAHKASADLIILGTRHAPAGDGQRCRRCGATDNGTRHARASAGSEQVLTVQHHVSELFYRGLFPAGLQLHAGCQALFPVSVPIEAALR